MDTNGIITTVAGNGSYGYSGDGGPATNATLSYLTGVAVDPYGNLFISDFQNFRVREVGTNGIINTVAGDGGFGFSGDGGPATNAEIETPEGVAVDASGDLFIADDNNGRIREVDSNGIITTVAGGGSGGDGGPATNASLNVPDGVAVDACGNLFIADTDDSRIRKVDTNGIITTVAGGGSGGDGGPAIEASLNGPMGVAVDASGNLFIADTGDASVRKVFANHTPILTLYNLTAEETGSYSVVVSNAYGSITSSVVSLSVGSPSSVSGQPQNQTVGAGSNAMFSVTAGGTSPFYYQWLFDGAALAGQTNSALSLDPAYPTNAGSYQVVVTNLYGSATSSVATLAVELIINQPQSQVAAVGSNATFGVTVTATAPFNYQWFFDGLALAGQTNSALELNAVTPANAGSYQVVVSNNLYGSATSSIATLTVAYPPVVTAQPQNQTVLAGNNATLSATVSGTGPFTYQWQFNGTNLPNGIITTVAGGGQGGDGGFATNASLEEPYGVAVDAYGNLFIADSLHNRIREVGTDGIITTVAGNGTNGYSGDGGAATSAKLNQPYGVALDSSGDLFIADTYNYRIRKVGANGIITTVAGDANSGYNGDGRAATNSSLSEPQGIAFDGDDNLLIADTYNNRIREVTFGLIITVAGGGGSNPGDGGAAISAILNRPSGVAVDAYGNLFIADTFNYRIQKVDDNGIITTVAGSGTSGYSGDGGAATNAKLSEPYGLALDTSGNVLISDTYNYRIRKVSTNGNIATVAGRGSYGFSGDGGSATNAYFNQPSGVAMDAYGNLFVADTGNGRIRKVIIQGPTLLVGNVNSNNAGNYDVVVTGPYGSVTSSVATITEAFGPGIAAPPQSQVALVGGTVTFSVTASGTGPFYYQWYFGGAPLSGQTNTTLVRSNVNSNNAGAYQVVIANPYAAVTSSIAALSVIVPALQPPSQTIVAGGSATLSVTVFGPGPLTYQWQCNGSNLPSSIITTVAGNGTAGYSGDGGVATNAMLHEPEGVAVDAYGNLFIADADNSRIREVGTNGIITTVAGKVAGYSGDGGAATNAGLGVPSAVTVDGFGNIFIADSGNNRIRKVGTNGIITTVAGNGADSYSGDGGAATNASLYLPSGVGGVAVDSYGNLFIADSFNRRIREVGTNGIINTFAGNGQCGSVDHGGTAISAGLNYPVGVTLDTYGNLFIADSEDLYLGSCVNNRIRQVGTSGIITTVVGNGTEGYSGDGGAGTNASLNLPDSVVVDPYGDLFIADSGNNRIREVGANGIINTVAGGGSGGDGGAATNASLNQPHGMALDAYGNLFIADASNNRIRKVVFQGPTLVLTNVAPGNAGSYDVVVTSTHGSAVSSVVNLTVLLPPQDLSASLIPGQGVQFQFTGTPTNAYVLLAATNLNPPINWQPVVTNFTDTNGNWTFTDTNALATPARFYRAMLP